MFGWIVGVGRKVGVFGKWCCFGWLILLGIVSCFCCCIYGEICYVFGLVIWCWFYLFGGVMGCGVKRVGDYWRIGFIYCLLVGGR